VQNSQVVNFLIFYERVFTEEMGGCRGCDHMVVGFTTTYAIDVYHQ
jgi:hypothetical protein